MKMEHDATVNLLPSCHLVESCLTRFAVGFLYRQLGQVGKSDDCYARLVHAHLLGAQVQGLFFLFSC